jgi:hypothetical protein
MSMLHVDPRLAEVPGCQKEKLDALARSVELRRQQLEDDIQTYIRTKQDELRKYEQEVRFLLACSISKFFEYCGRLIWA